MALVVDVLIAAKRFLRDECNDATDALLERILQKGAYVCFVWNCITLFSVRNVRAVIDPDDMGAALDLLRDLPIVLVPARERFLAGNGIRIARHYDLTLFDVAYLCLAAGRNVPLATGSSLAYAASDLGVIVFS